MAASFPNIAIHQYAPTPYSGARAQVSATLPSGTRVTFDASGPSPRYGDEVGPPTVNWSAIGSVSVEDAVAFAEVLIAAAHTAEALAGPLEGAAANAWRARAER